MARIVRTVAFSALGLVLSVASLGGMLAGGLVVTMQRSFPEPPAKSNEVNREISSRAGVADDLIPVAVLLGANGSVATDVLAPYAIFAESKLFDVYTVSVRREPVALSGGLSVFPDYSVQDILDGNARDPAIVVVPAMVDPSGADEAPLRELIERTARAGNVVMSVCAGAQVLAATDVLRGRNATSFWSDIDGLRASHPETTWESGVRWVQDGAVLTTAGVSSGIAGSLHMVELYAGVDEARRIADAIGYPAWKPGPAQAMPVNSTSLRDYPYLLAATLPWFQPIYGLGLTNGVDEIAVAAAAELYGGVSYLARVLPVAEGTSIVTEHGMTLLTTPISSAGQLDRLVVPGVQHTTLRAGDAALYLPARDRRAGESDFDPIFRDIAQQAGTNLAQTSAKYIEYPIGAVPSDSSLPVRLTLLALAVLLIASVVGAVPWVIRALRRRERARS